MMPPAYFEHFACYNTWANARLYAAAAALPAAEIAKPRPAAYFTSLLGTLNHGLVGDLIWMGRFEGKDHGIHSQDQILHPDLTALLAARKAEDARIEAYIGGLTAERIAGELRFRTLVKPAEVRQPLWQALAHFFNHQTHHRGQAHALLKEAGVEPPPLDMIFYQRETAASPEGS